MSAGGVAVVDIMQALHNTQIMDWRKQGLGVVEQKAKITVQVLSNEVIGNLASWLGASWWECLFAHLPGRWKDVPRTHHRGEATECLL